MKKIVNLLFLLLIVVLPLKVKALSIDKNNLTIKKSSNETIALYAEVDTEITEVNFNLVYTTYDIPAYFNVEAGLSDQASGTKHKITFPEPVTGKIRLGTIRVNVVNNPQVSAGTVNIHTATALTKDGINKILTTQIINVTVDKTQEITETPVINAEESTNLLEKIESKLVNINLKENIYEYNINIQEGIEELDLQPIARDEKYKVDISTQKISELVDNQIIITVTKDEDNIEEYKIKVNVIKNIEIDEEEFESNYKYKGKWVILISIFLIVLFIGLFLNTKKH